MRLGFNLPQMGPAASAENLVTVAKRAEELGYETLWVTERLLFPVDPKTAYPVSPDGSLPDVYKTVLDPIESLTYVAAHTSKIGFGTSVLDSPYYNPVMLARRLTTLDVLSNGRLRLGMGLGWSEDEYEASGAEMTQKGKRADEFIGVLKAIWTTDPSQFSGDFYKLAKSTILPKPVQKPHPPIYLAAYSPGAMKRVATLADGWLPAGLPIPAMKEMWEGIKGMAQQAGRNPDDLDIVVRANLMLTDSPMGDERFAFAGSKDEIKSDIEASREMGVLEVAFDPSFEDAGQTVDGFLQRMDQMRELAG
ncbi:MAG: LLM class F420-dependent oxidoreductase [Chloroflexi bacterium]|nr:LLM class F420-dependent oxidoreductase [Chloroflexota bacterium]